MKVITLLLIGALLGLTGCSSEPIDPKQPAFDPKPAELVYNRPLAEVWPKVRRFFYEHGLEPKNPFKRGSYTLETDWRDEGHASRARYRAEGMAVTEGSCRIRVTRTSEGTYFAGLPSDREDRRLEWEMLERIDPAQAHRLEAEAGKPVPKG